MIAWIFAIVPFGLGSWALYHYSQAASLTGYETTLIGVNLTLAVFAVNFAFLGYQSSSFRSLRRGIALNVVFGSLFVILIATVPLAALVFVRARAPRISLSLIPIVAYCSIALLAVAQHEADPIVLLKRFCSRRKVRRFFRKFSKDAYSRHLSIKRQELSKPGDMPMHEFEWHISPDSTLADPFSTLFGVALASVKSSNLFVFERAVQLGLEHIDSAARFAPPVPGSDTYKVRGFVQRHVDNCISRVVSEVIENDRSGAFVRKALDVLSLYVINKAAIALQTSDQAFLALSLMTELGKHSLKLGQYQSALIPVIVARQVTQKGLDNPLPSAEDDAKADLTFFNHALSQLPNTIRRMGSYAVTQKDSNYVYRCLDAFGWLGCSAVKTNHILVGRTCLRSIAQLGRECRAHELECFWDRCALQPSDHAKERIDWMATWVHRLNENARDPWLRSIGEALSRLQGKNTSLSISEKDGKPIINYHVSSEPHTLTYMSDGISRTIDYSNSQELKDFELY